MAFAVIFDLEIFSGEWGLVISASADHFLKVRTYDRKKNRSARQ
jgi:hypothetical protein